LQLAFVGYYYFLTLGDFDMELHIEVKLVAEYDEDCDGNATLTALRFPSCTQNVLIFMSPAEQQTAQESLVEAVQDAAIAKVERLLEQRGARLGQYRSPRNGE
jgi:hypothetical protein